MDQTSRVCDIDHGEARDFPEPIIWAAPSWTGDDADFELLIAAAQPKGEAPADWSVTTGNVLSGALDDVVYGLLAQDHISEADFRELTEPLLTIAEGSLKRKQKGEA